MNINTVWSNTIDSISSIKDKVVEKYNNTNMTPFPKNVNVTIKLDMAGTYGDMIDALDKLSPKRIEQVVSIFKKHQGTITKIIEDEIK
tara:strand:- start:42 stop:305 length:264 start_codon:yes stop_codon:yes gene_type:complete